MEDKLISELEYCNICTKVIYKLARLHHIKDVGYMRHTPRRHFTDKEITRMLKLIKREER